MRLSPQKYLKADFGLPSHKKLKLMFPTNPNQVSKCTSNKLLTEARLQVEELKLDGVEN